MRLTSPTRRRPTPVERLLGKRRARRLRRRLGLAALATGVVLLRPRHSWAPLFAAMVVAVAAGGALAAMR